MRFIDRVRVLVRAGDGGDGIVAWRREAHVSRGGPAGGDGGRGGDVVFVADDQLSTLLDFRYRRQFRAPSGGRGGSKGKQGRGGEDLVIRLPAGTGVYFDGRAEEEVPEEPTEGIEEEDTEWGGQRVLPARLRSDLELHETDELLGDMVEQGQLLMVARGGLGGRGNIHFRSATNRAPKQAERGGGGQALWLRLELRLLADVGIVGFPNVGKSTLISRISRARPEIADYPFTTLVPQLGVVGLSDERSMVVADVPGLIEGASDGKGLGHEFLRHLERTRVLLHVLSPDPTEGREPMADLDALERELTRYGTMFRGRPRVVAFNKIDTPQGQTLLQETKQRLAERQIPVFPICAISGEGVPALLEALWRRLTMVRGGAGSESQSPSSAPDDDPGGSMAGS